MPTLDAALRARCEAWKDDDPDELTRAELDAWLAADDTAAIVDAFSTELEFGTAGLRGLLGPGPNRMNRRVVARATAGLCAHLLATTPEARTRGVAIGYDGRRRSADFARDVAELCAGHGFRVYAFEHVVPTPLVGFVTKRLGCAAGVVVTASHNPPAYNGYKVYWGNGAQIIPPIDAGIAAEIARVGRVLALPRMTRDAAASAGLYVALGEEIIAEYLRGVRALALHPETPRNLTIAYTALHGVGETTLRRALAEAGFERVHSVAEQAEPDGAFPTVAFPNPEEKGAMDMVLALAERERADLVIANDPDADRLALAVRAPDGHYVQLTGNQVGQLLAHYLLSEDRGPREGRFVCCSIVSSPMLGEIAQQHGAYFEQVLTGFKWIANRAMQIEQERGARFVMGYEEALGYTVGTLVRDKDGISAAAVAADMAAYYRSRGQSLLDVLDDMARRYGLYLSEQVSVTLPGREGKERIGRIMKSVRAVPPARVGDVAVTAVLDLETGTRTAVPGGARERVALPPSDVLALDLEGGHRIMLRPSGTEPKIKYYFDVRIALNEGESVSAASERGRTLLGGLVAAFRGLVDAVV